MPTEISDKSEARISLLVPKQMRDELKIAAIREGKTLNDLIVEGLRPLLNKIKKVA